MDLLRYPSVRVDAYASPAVLIEGYSSLIWTEKYQDPGTFELKTNKVRDTLTKLKLGSLLTLRNSNEIMMIENQEISTDDNGYAQLTCTGRSIASILEARIIEGPYGTKFNMGTYRNLDAALLYIWNSVVNATGVDAILPSGTTVTPTAAKVITNAVVSDSFDGAAETAIPQLIEMGVAWPQIRAWLVAGQYGIRIIKPNAQVTSASVVTVITADGGSKGTVQKTNTDVSTKIRFDVYGGHDRTLGNGILPEVLFSLDQGHIDNARYLFSLKDYRTHAVIGTSVGTRGTWAIPRDTNDENLYSRNMYLDGGSPTAGDNTTIFLDRAESTARDVLSKNKQLSLFDADIMPTNPHKYNVDYFLGDLITIRGDYGFNQSMQVVEYVQVSDADGTRAYPTLTQI